MWVARITLPLPHFSVSSAMNFPNSAGVLGSTVPAPAADNTRRLRKVEAEVRGVDVGQGSAIVDVAKVPALLIGQPGAKLAWPVAPPQNVALDMLSMFARNGAGNPSEDATYELIYDEAIGHRVMHR
jgi:hypothetical protein